MSIMSRRRQRATKQKAQDLATVSAPAPKKQTKKKKPKGDNDGAD